MLSLNIGIQHPFRLHIQFKPLMDQFRLADTINYMAHMIFQVSKVFGGMTLSQTSYHEEWSWDGNIHSPLISHQTKM